MDRRHRLAVALAVGHTLLLVAYVLPAGLVPERFRVLGQAYARPLFHQSWGLFAPDPPACSCDWSGAEGVRGMVLERSLNGLCRHAQALPACAPGSDTCAVPVELVARVMRLTGLPEDGLMLQEACLPDRGIQVRPVHPDRR